MQRTQLRNYWPAAGEGGGEDVAQRGGRQLQFAWQENALNKT